MKKYSLSMTLLVTIVLFSCQKANKQSNLDKSGLNTDTLNTESMHVSKKIYGTNRDGKPVHSFILKNNKGMEVEILEIGAIVATIKVPDKKGDIADVVLGYDDIQGFEEDSYYFGATIGRVANRTSGAVFSIDGQDYKLAPNTLPDFGYNHLHGGKIGYNKKLWEGTEFSNHLEAGVTLIYLSPDGEEGYPGNINNKVTYTLNNDGELGILLEATTDKPTFVNMTHHSYFNLSGAGSGTVLDTRIMINADKYTPADDDLIPIGDISEVKGSPVDFTTERTIASQMDDMQMAKFKGYDLNYVLNHTGAGALDLAAKAIDPVSGRVLEIFTTQPCMHFYTSNFLEGKPGKGGKAYDQYGAFCFEPQGYPDAPNKPQFESVELRPGENYKQKIIYKFSLLE